jgi:DNA polymerase lambda
MVLFPLYEKDFVAPRKSRRYVFAPFVEEQPPTVSTEAIPVIAKTVIEDTTKSSKDVPPLTDIVQVQTITKRLVQYSSYLEQRIQRSGPKAAGFACLRTGQDGTMVVRINNYNVHLTVPLEKLLTLYSARLSGDSLDDYRTRNLRRFIDFIKRVPKKLTCLEDLKQVIDNNRQIGAGKKTLGKVEEIFLTGTCSALEVRINDETLRSMIGFTKIWGIGAVKARTIAIDNNIRTVSELKERMFNEPINPPKDVHGREFLGPDERECLKYYDDLIERMPRSEAGQLVAKVNEAAIKVYGEGKAIVVGAGSYRREKETCGDVDVLISTVSRDEPLLDLNILRDELYRSGVLIYTLRGGENSLGNEDQHFGKRPHMLPKLNAAVHKDKLQNLKNIEKLVRIQGLAENNSSSEEDDELTRKQRKLDGGGTKVTPVIEGATFLPREEYPHHLYMGLARLSPDHKVRRIDIKIYDRKVLAFALLYFTGSDYFNRSLRLLCQKSGWTLSDQGLRKTQAGASYKTREWRSRSIACESELDVLTAIGAPWREPKDRDMELQEIDMEISSSLAVDGSGFVNADALDNDFSDSEII